MCYFTSLFTTLLNLLETYEKGTDDYNHRENNNEDNNPCRWGAKPLIHSTILLFFQSSILFGRINVNPNILLHILENSPRFSGVSVIRIIQCRLLGIRDIKKLHCGGIGCNIYICLTF